MFGGDSIELLTVKPSLISMDSLSAFSLSELIISSINSSRDILGFQPKFLKALLGSPTNSSTSVGLKYLGSLY